MSVRWFDRRRRSADDGFTLIEAIVALSIAAVIFMALAFALIGGVHQALFAQQNQQAGDILNKTVEQARALPYDSLAMQTSDLSVNESLNLSACASPCYNPQDDGTTGATEALVLDAAGGVSPHVTTVSQNGLSFTVRRYVTVPADHLNASYKRFTTLVTWTSLGKTHTRSSSTLISPTVRGLPLPDFKFSNAGPTSQCRNPGSPVVYALSLVNNGARDAWDLTASTTGSPPPSGWTFYLDDGDKTYDSGDQPLSTSSSTNLPTTGLMEPTTSVTLFAVAQAPTSDESSSSYTWHTSFTATSEADSTASQVVATTTSVMSGACAGSTGTTDPPPSGTANPPQPAVCSPVATASASGAGGSTLYTYYLHNQGTNNDNSALQSVMPFDKTQPSSSTLWDYSADADNGQLIAGRYIGSGHPFATWRYGMPANSTLKGTGTVTLYAQRPVVSNANTQTITVTLQRLSSNGSVLGDIASNTVTSTWGCDGMAPFTVALAMPSGGQAIAANEQLQLVVTMTSSDAMRLGYDATPYVGSLTLPYSKGVG